MKTKKLTNRYQKKFAWWPVWLTHGNYDAGKRAFFETVYCKISESTEPLYVQAISKRDYEYNQQMLVEIKTNPERFGNDPQREEYF